jgi:hypothetical protein
MERYNRKVFADGRDERYLFKDTWPGTLIRNKIED